MTVVVYKNIDLVPKSFKIRTAGVLLYAKNAALLGKHQGGEYSYLCGRVNSAFATYSDSNQATRFTSNYPTFESPCSAAARELFEETAGLFSISPAILAYAPVAIIRFSSECDSVRAIFGVDVTPEMMEAIAEFPKYLAARKLRMQHEFCEIEKLILQPVLRGLPSIDDEIHTNVETLCVINELHSALQSIQPEHLLYSHDCSTEVAIRQNSKEWHECRRGAISGTRVSTLLGRSPFSNLSNLVNELKTGHSTFIPTVASSMGHVYEDLLYSWYNEFMGPLRKVGILCDKVESKIVASPDAMRKYSNMIIEIKSSGYLFTKNTPYLYGNKLFDQGHCGDISPLHYDQIQFTGGLAGCEWCDYMMYNTKTNELSIERIKIDSAYFAVLYDIANKFMREM